MPLLEVQNITKRFGKLEVLKGIDFSLNQGEVLSIIGSSGSGKTTLLRCITQLEQATPGKMFVDGKEVFDAQQKITLTKEEKRERQFCRSLKSYQIELFVFLLCIFFSKHFLGYD